MLRGCFGKLIPRGFSRALFRGFFPWAPSWGTFSALFFAGAFSGHSFLGAFPVHSCAGAFSVRSFTARFLVRFFAVAFPCALSQGLFA